MVWVLKVPGGPNNVPHYAALKVGPGPGRFSPGVPLPSYNCLVICSLMSGRAISPHSRVGGQGTGSGEGKEKGGIEARGN